MMTGKYMYRYNINTFELLSKWKEGKNKIFVNGNKGS